MPSVHAFFDFDDTLLHGDSILYWLRFYYRRRPGRRFFLAANWFGLALFLARIIDSHALKRIFLWPMAYEKPADLDRMGAAFVRDDLARRFNAPVLRRLWGHHLLGHKIMILSASATFYLKHLKTLLPMADVEGTEMLWPERGLWRFPRYRYGNLRGANKIARLHALGFAHEPPCSFAYSDHHHDAHLLGFSEFPTAVQPTPKLRRLARKHDWPILEWKTGKSRGRELLDKLKLLVFASGRDADGSDAALDPRREEEAARAYAPAEIEALRRRVAMRYAEDRNPDVYKRVFPARVPETAGRMDAPGI